MYAYFYASGLIVDNNRKITIIMVGRKLFIAKLIKKKCKKGTITTTTITVAAQSNSQKAHKAILSTAQTNFQLLFAEKLLSRKLTT